LAQHARGVTDAAPSCVHDHLATSCDGGERKFFNQSDASLVITLRPLQTGTGRVPAGV
jgi:hypothetical protein